MRGVLVLMNILAGRRHHRGARVRVRGPPGGDGPRQRQGGRQRAGFWCLGFFRLRAGIIAERAFAFKGHLAETALDSDRAAANARGFGI